MNYTNGELVSLFNNRMLDEQDCIEIERQLSGVWQPIDTAPRDGSDILLSDGTMVSVGGWLSDIAHGAEYEGQLGMAGWWAIDLGSNNDRPTHWMPLPPPPEEQE